MEEWELKDDDDELAQLVIKEGILGVKEKFGQGESYSCFYLTGSTGPSTEASGFHIDKVFACLCNCSIDTSCINIFISWVFGTSTG